jgi:hypothetical protein
MMRAEALEGLQWRRERIVEAGAGPCQRFEE